jgi:hypothetical protein
VTKKQPFLPGFPTTICGRIRRRLQDAIAAKRRALAESSIASYALQFSHVLSAEFLHAQSGTRRRRHYCNVTVFWAWLAQALEANASCSKAVSLVQSWCEDAGLPRPSSDTGAYCKARGRVGLGFLRAARAKVVAHMSAGIRPEDKYEGLTVKSFDGSSVQLDDTAENQAAYPQPTSQKPGCGFPVMGVMAVLNHSHGGWEGFATDKHTVHDAPFAHAVLGCFGEGDLCLGDRAFCTYELFASLAGRGAHSLMRLHQARHRKLDWRRGKKIGKNERLVTWTKPKRPAKSALGPAEWDALPDEMEVRLVRFIYEDRGGKMRRMVIATTLLDNERYEWADIATLYARRWEIELRLRDVKTTMRMEALRAKTPATAHKALEMAVIGYNLVRSACQEAAREAGEGVAVMSFKGALDTVVAASVRYCGRGRQPGKIREIWRDIIGAIAEKLVVLRPHRREPRAVKRRPKSYGYLTLPRAEFREILHRGKHRAHA